MDPQVPTGQMPQPQGPQIVESPQPTSERQPVSFIKFKAAGVIGIIYGLLGLAIILTLLMIGVKDWVNTSNAVLCLVIIFCSIQLLRKPEVDRLLRNAKVLAAVLVATLVLSLLARGFAGLLAIIQLLVLVFGVRDLKKAGLATTNSVFTAKPAL